MIKKFTALAAAAAMAITALPANAAAYTDVDIDTETGYAIEALSALGVISGMGDGTFAPYSTLTRAQFAKIAVYLLGKADEAVAVTDAFSDVSSSDWFSGYVSAVASEGIIEGYPDGSFGAYENITYAQTLTVLVRLLGYSASDVGYKWPQGYIDKAKVLGIIEDESFNANDAITRGEAAKLIYRTVYTDMKEGSAKLITKMDFTVYEDTVILATKNENSALLDNEIQTSAGTFKRVGSFEAPVGYEGTLTVNDDDEVIGFVKDDNMAEESYVISRVYQETNSTDVTILSDKGNTIKLDNETAIYQNGTKLSAKDLTDVTEGSSITLYYENGSLRHGFLNEYTMQGPKTATVAGNVENLFDIDDYSTLTVIRKGETSSIDDIEVYDVCYYSEKTNTLYAYNNRVTGVYEEAYPLKSNVSSVKVAGTTYSVVTTEAMSKLGESAGSFKIGDRVTLLLNSDGEVVDVVDLNSSDISLYGVVVGTGTETSTTDGEEGKTDYTVTILMADGTEKTYKTDTDTYDDDAGRFCEVDFENSYAKLAFPSSKKITGKVSRTNKEVDGVAFAADYSILEYEGGDEEAADVKKITLSDLENVTLTNSNCMHAELNLSGEIVVLYVKDASATKYTYGVVTDVQEGNPSDTYTLLSGAQKYTIQGSYPSITEGTVIGVYQYDSDTEIKYLTKTATGTEITDRSDNIIKLNGQSYLMADDVKVYAGRYIYEVKAASLDELKGMTGNITLYSDTSVKQGGKVRVIVVLDS